MIKITGTLFPPFANSCAFRYHSSSKDKCSNPGLKVEYLQIIQEHGLLEFDVIQQKNPGGAGILDKNLTWTKPIGQILDGSLDSMVPYVVATPERIRYFDFRFVYHPRCCFIAFGQVS